MKKAKRSLLEIVIKFFIKIVMLVAVPLSLRKNKNKLGELVGRVYKRFTSRDFVFIPVSFAFYSLVSFIPIILSVSVALSLIPGEFSTLFNNEILKKNYSWFRFIYQFSSTNIEMPKHLCLLLHCF
nr:hypothetical protein [Mycoplasmopsis bovis]